MYVKNSIPYILKVFSGILLGIFLVQIMNKLDAIKYRDLSNDISFIIFISLTWFLISTFINAAIYISLKVNRFQRK